MKVGYIKYHPQDPASAEEIVALEQEGCKRVFKDRTQSLEKNSLVLKQALTYMEKEDILVVYSLASLSSNLKCLNEIIRQLKSEGKYLISVTEKINTQDPESASLIETLSYWVNFQSIMVRKKIKYKLMKSAPEK